MLSVEQELLKEEVPQYSTRTRRGMLISTINVHIMVFMTIFLLNINVIQANVIEANSHCISWTHLVFTKTKAYVQLITSTKYRLDAKS